MIKLIFNSITLLVIFLYTMYGQEMEEMRLIKVCITDGDGFVNDKMFLIIGDKSQIRRKEGGDGSLDGATVSCMLWSDYKVCLLYSLSQVVTTGACCCGMSRRVCSTRMNHK